MILRALILILLGAQTFAAEINIAFIRYRPDDKTQLLNPVRANISPAKLRSEKSEAILADLRQKGSASLVFQTTETLPDDKPKKIEKSETASVVLPGDETAFPKITKLELKFEIQNITKASQNHLTWDGTIHWSPEILDHVITTTQTKTTTTLIRPFAPAGTTTGFEYPVLKQTTFQSSKIVQPGELIITSTAAESGARPPELLLLCLWLSQK